MDQELVSLLQSPDREKAAKGAQMLAAFLSKASFPSKSVQALREVTLRSHRALPLGAAAVPCVRRAGAAALGPVCVRTCLCVHACVRVSARARASPAASAEG